MVLVHYRADLPQNQPDELRAFVTSETDRNGVLAGPEPGQTEGFKAVNRRDTMARAEYDLTPLRAFKTQWFNDPAASNP